MKKAQKKKNAKRAKRLRRKRVRICMTILAILLCVAIITLVARRIRANSQDTMTAVPTAQEIQTQQEEPAPVETEMPEEPVPEETVPEETAAEEPVTEEPLTEEPLTEETALDEIAAGEPVLEEPVSVFTVKEEEQPALLEIGEIVDAARVDNPKLNYRAKLYDGTNEIATYTRANPISMGNDGYADLEGVSTFRGDNLRNNAAYGTVPENAHSLKVVWKVPVGKIDKWSGVGWTGQPAIVRWSEETRQIMNIKESKRNKEGLVEVIYAALDGKIRFLDLEDGEETRNPISVPASIKGSVTVDPRGYPLLYCGQGIDNVKGKAVKIGTRVFSLIDQQVLLFINGRDDLRTRNWYACDAAPLVDKQTDTLLQISENGLFYSVELNTQFDAANGTISIDPKITRFAYKSDATKRPGMENSLSVYNHYGYFADNSGLLQCVDLNDMTCKWAFVTGDDTDATTAIEETEDGVWLYTGNEIDLRGNSGKSNLRCFNAMTGELRWQVDVPVHDKEHGGLYGSPAIGKQSLSELVYFNISKTDQGGTLAALDKETGEIVWKMGLKKYSWSTPLLVYDDAGEGYVIIGNSNGALKLVDGLTGKVLDTIDLKRNIEGSPAAFDDMIVVGTRGGTIYGIRIK